MKQKRNTLTCLLIFAATFIGMSMAQADQPVTREVVAPVNSVFIPGGFDSASDAYVVVNGIYPNGCYRWSRAETVTRDTFQHDITTMALVTQGMCIQVLIPYQKEIRLGRLASGKHTLKFLNSDGTYIEKQLVVE